MAHPTCKDTRPPPAKVLAGTPICLHLIECVAPCFVIQYLGSCKLETGVERISTHRFAHVDDESAPARIRLLWLASLRLLAPESLALLALVLESPHRLHRHVLQAKSLELLLGPLCSSLELALLRGLAVVCLHRALLRAFVDLATKLAVVLCLRRTLPLRRRRSRLVGLACAAVRRTVHRYFDFALRIALGSFEYRDEAISV